MGLVKTAEEIARIERTLRNPRFVNGEMLSVDFLTDPEIVARILPPTLEPAEAPRITAMVGRWRSNCVGDYCGGAIYVAARHGDIEGDYVLAMYMDTDRAILFGRDVFGEPKKQARSQLYRSGERFFGMVERDGVRLIELRAELPEELGPGAGEGRNFNIKARPAVDGAGLEEDAILTLATFSTTVRAARAGSGSVVLRGTVHDPIDEIRVASPLGARFVECDIAASSRALARIPAQAYLPYHHGRHDDWSALDTEAAPLAVR